MSTTKSLGGTFASVSINSLLRTVGTGELYSISADGNCFFNEEGFPTSAFYFFKRVEKLRKSDSALLSMKMLCGDKEAYVARKITAVDEVEEVTEFSIEEFESKVESEEKDNAQTCKIANVD